MTDGDRAGTGMAAFGHQASWSHAAGRALA
jgi:hypothetical protein